MRTLYGIRRLHLTDGNTVEPPLNGMTIFTGPNNSGKSVMLRELVTSIYNYPNVQEPERWINQVELHRDGDANEFLEWIAGRGFSARYHEVSKRFLLPARHSMTDENGPSADQVEALWGRGEYGAIGHFLVNDQWTESRLSDQTTSVQWDWKLPANHPSQVLWESPEALAGFSGLFERAFGKKIAINRYQHSIRLQVGETKIPDTPPPPPQKLMEDYASLPYVSEQGDGMRAFVNLILHTLVRPAPVIVIDEPEAFLHPPQARLLARYLTQYVPAPCQVFVATHSSDFLAGAMEGNAVSPGRSGSARSLSLVRIDRSKGKSSSRMLAPERVREILDTPLLRYSNIISGIFHDGVILCESEGDCHFYAATSDFMQGDSPNANLIYLHVNGKVRLGDSVAKLRACGIPAVAIADLDFLNDARNVEKAVRALGGTWEDIRDDVQAVNRHASSEVITKPAFEIKQEIIQAIGNPRGRETLAQDQIARISESLKKANGWKHIKGSGVRALGSQYATAQKVLTYLANLGFFLVPEGELECWVREVPSGNKSAWLTRVFEDGFHERPNTDLQNFLASVLSYLSQWGAPTEQPDGEVSA
ncbi:ATP-dependent nuclease [Streptomyces sp. Tue6028]|uniref:ATP-dependent nuclease n=1 Tax=Streptomyces sp. Tue6028 TaxID=2036037 RepID=UPI003D729366